MAIRPITDVLRQIGGGTFIDEASEKLAELVTKADETGKGCTLTLAITIKKATRSGAMHVGGKITSKAPADEPMEALMFATPEGNLLIDDPKQERLDLRIADVQSAELKTAATAAATELKTA